MATVTTYDAGAVKWADIRRRLSQFFPGHARPTVSDFSPASGSNLASGHAVSFDANAPAGISRVVVYATFADGLLEVIYDGASFSPGYSPGSTLTKTRTSYSFSVKRALGWRAGAMSLTVIVVDIEGQVTTA